MARSKRERALARQLQKTQRKAAKTLAVWLWVFGSERTIEKRSRLLACVPFLFLVVVVVVVAVKVVVHMSFLLSEWHGFVCKSLGMHRRRSTEFIAYACVCVCEFVCCAAFRSLSVLHLSYISLVVCACACVCIRYIVY